MPEHYYLSMPEAHSSYSRGCRCYYCRRGHATHRRWLRAQANPSPNAPTPPTLFDAPVGGRSQDTPRYAPILRPNEPLGRLTQPRTGFHHRDASDTERAAAKKQTQLVGRRLEVFGAIAAAPGGLTRHEVTQVSGVVLQTVCGRVKELLDAGYLLESGKRQDRAVLYLTDRGHKARAKQLVNP